MKKSTYPVAVTMTAALACLFAVNMGCRKQSPPPAPPTEPTIPTVTNAPTDANTNASVVAPTPVPAPEPMPEPALAITNPPPATTTPEPPPAPEPAPVTPPPPKIVEMPTTPPAPPTNFYSGDLTNKTNPFPLVPKEEPAPERSYSLRLRAGYQHANHGDNHDTYFLSAQVAFNGDALRDAADKNAWLVPDAAAEISHQFVAKPDNSKPPGSGEGLQFRADFYWPWMSWTSSMFHRTDGHEETHLPLKFSLGPTANVGFDLLFDDSKARLTRHAGLRASLNHGYLEYTVGATDGLTGTRSQVRAEIPFYRSRHNQVRYYFRGLWDSGYNHSPDALEAALFLEMPLETLVSPGKWRSAIPGLE